MSLSGKYVRAQTEDFVLFRSEVDEQITVRLPRRVFICFESERGLVGIHLARQTCKLTRVSGIFEQNHVMRIETYGPDVSVLVE